jgi:hypothetical protein
MASKGPKNDIAGHILSSSLSLMGILIGVVGLLFSQYHTVAQLPLKTLKVKYNILLILSSFLVVLSGGISFLALLNLKGFAVSINLIFYLIILLILIVTIGIPVWVFFSP